MATCLLLSQERHWLSASWASAGGTYAVAGLAHTLGVLLLTLWAVLDTLHA